MNSRMAAVSGCYGEHYEAHLVGFGDRSRKLSVESDPKLRPQK